MIDKTKVGGVLAPSAPQAHTLLRAPPLEEIPPDAAGVLSPLNPGDIKILPSHWAFHKRLGGGGGSKSEVFYVTDQDNRSDLAVKVFACGSDEHRFALTVPRCTLSFL